MGARILIVEDEQIVAEDIRRSLLNLGYSVISVESNGEDAIRKALATRPDLILMDIVIKGKMDGIETACLVRSRLDIPVIFLTAYSDEETMERAKMTEPFGYIFKPYQDRELHINIQMALYKSKMDKEIKESKEWFSTTLDSIGEGVIATDINGHVIYMNHIARDLTGREPEDVLGKPVTEIYKLVDEVTGDPLESPLTRAIQRTVRTDPKTGTLLVSADGRRIPVEDIGSPIRNKKGELNGLVFIFSDITERRKAEIEIIENKEFYENVLDGFVSGVSVTGSEGIVCYSNDSMTKILGLERKINGKRIFDVFPEEVNKHIERFYKKARETKHPVYYKNIPLLTATLRESKLSGWFIPVIKKSEFTGMICIFEDSVRHKYAESNE